VEERNINKKNPHDSSNFYLPGNRLVWAFWIDSFFCRLLFDRNSLGLSVHLLLLLGLFSNNHLLVLDIKNKKIFQTGMTCINPSTPENVFHLIYL